MYIYILKRPQKFDKISQLICFYLHGKCQINWEVISYFCGLSAFDEISFNHMQTRILLTGSNNHFQIYKCKFHEFFDQIEKVLSVLFFFVRKDFIVKRLRKFRISSFRMGCWTQWTNYEWWKKFLWGRYILMRIQKSSNFILQLIAVSKD